MRLVLSLLILLTSPANACAVAEDFHVTDVAFGPVVVVARVADYKVEKGFGVLLLEVSEVWKGQAPDSLTAHWGETMAELPPNDWARPDRVIAALVPTGTGFDLKVEMCGSAWLVPDTPENRSQVRAALAP